jgi:hypothetical protein
MRALVAATLLCLIAASLEAQMVRGRVLDHGTRQPIAGVQLTLRNPQRVIVAQAVSDSLGLFQLITRDAAEYRIEAKHIAYADVGTTVQVRKQEMVAVDVLMSVRTIAVDPVIVTARKQDPRHDPSYDGFLARRAMVPPIGSRRVLMIGDPEMEASFVVSEAVLWGRPPALTHSRRQPITRCAAVWWNGFVLDNEANANAWLDEISLRHVGGVEYYLFDEAPFGMRQIPSYFKADRVPCAVIAIWPIRELVPSR